MTTKKKENLWLISLGILPEGTEHKVEAEFNNDAYVIWAKVAHRIFCHGIINPSVEIPYNLRRVLFWLKPEGFVRLIDNHSSMPDHEYEDAPSTNLETRI